MQIFKLVSFFLVTLIIESLTTQIELFEIFNLQNLLFFYKFLSILMCVSLNLSLEASENLKINSIFSILMVILMASLRTVVSLYINENYNWPTWTQKRPLYVTLTPFLAIFFIGITKILFFNHLFPFWALVGFFSLIIYYTGFLIVTKEYEQKKQTLFNWNHFLYSIYYFIELPVVFYQAWSKNSYSLAISNFIISELTELVSCFIFFNIYTYNKTEVKAKIPLLNWVFYSVLYTSILFIQNLQSLDLDSYLVGVIAQFLYLTSNGWYSFYKNLSSSQNKS